MHTVENNITIKAWSRESIGDRKLLTTTMEDDKPVIKEESLSDDNDDGTETSRKRRSPSPSVDEEVEAPEVVVSGTAALEETAVDEEEVPPVEEVEAAAMSPPPPPPPPAYSRPAVIRKSPPSARSSAAATFPVTPASNPAVAVRRAAKKPASSPVLSTPAPTGKAQRGLRHFSIMVCKHVEEMGTTTYNQVADELVSQVIAERNGEGGPKGKFDEKNIRRRVYDALNVLLAMDIIAKDKKDIIWRGLPQSVDSPPQDPKPEGVAPKEEKPAPPFPPVDTRPIYTDEGDYDEHEFAAMQREQEYLEAEVARKQEALREILVQQVCFRNLVMRNQKREYPHGKAHQPPAADEKIPLPFIISNTRRQAVVQCDMNKEKTEVMFEFDSAFEVNDDNTILKRMEMDRTTVHALQGMLPEDMFDYCRDTGVLDSVLLQGENPNTTARAPQYHAYERTHRRHHRY